ncbi:hypothetical protein CYMTET_35861 [Cymbomonas tetramitiformis]|uniref:HAT C-terminal dimerisation domain-containing protein n=1 Tax=Cymbomonas tetramitiformis TaxID=36881 RepID=A0AAE0KN69_9CHLO|nr:hypothetical protein CYMTET_35861 [Cymbomonas tetramitiformis]|eukprot:gene34344-biopygen26359
MHKDSVVKFEGEVVPILNEHVKVARENLYKEICKRYFNDLMECKLEDFCVATFLDPRCTHFNFKFLTRWSRGTLTAEKAVGWAKASWDQDWTPKVLEEEATVEAPAAKSRKVEKASVASFLDDSDDDELVAPASGVVPAGATPEAPNASDDFSKYLALPVATSEVNPLDWWRVHSAIFPELAKVARQFLAAHANTAGVERAFSACGAMHSDLRKGLSEGTIEHAMMAAMN